VGFFLAFADCRHWLDTRGGRTGAGPGRTGQAGLKNQGLLFTGETAGFSGEGIIVFTDDVDLLTLLLR